jgi:hypothetical protein
MWGFDEKFELAECLDGVFGGGDFGKPQALQ